MLAKLKDSGVRAHTVGLLCNAMLTGLKFVVGWIAASEALIADGFNSAGDIFATGVGFVGYVYSLKPADEDHHYGHGNAESVAGLIIGGMLAATGIFISIEGVLALIRGKTEAPGVAALWIAGLTIVVKEALYHYATTVGRRINSASLLASARDHRADVMIGATVFVAITGARLGVPALDPMAALSVGLYIAWFAIEPIRTNVGVLMDQAPPALREEIRRIVIADPDVREADWIRVHPIGPRYVVDLEIYLDGSLPLHDAHAIAHRVGDAVVEAFDLVQDVKVHVNPTGTPA